MRRFFVLGIAAIVLGVGTPSARAVSLESLLTPGATFTNGDKVFSDFTYVVNTGDTMPSAANVSITAVTDIYGNIGIRIGGSFYTTPGTSADVTLAYDVTTTGGLISDVHMFGNPSLLGAGANGAISVTETVQPVIPPAPPTTLGQLNIYASSAIGSQLSDSLVLSTDYTTLRLTKDILAYSVVGQPILSVIDQTFSQVPSVPEPTTLCGAGIAVFFGLACAWRRRRAKAA